MATRTILCISGSVRQSSANNRLLEAIIKHFPEPNIHQYSNLDQLPLFNANLDRAPWPTNVSSWRNAVKNADALIISTPEYLHNIPALLKNALEWLTSSGELMEKPVLAITHCPHPPRGEKAMKSLIWSLQALNSRIVAQLPLYQNELSSPEGTIEFNEEMNTLLDQAIQLL